MPSSRSDEDEVDIAETLLAYLERRGFFVMLLLRCRRWLHLEPHGSEGRVVERTISALDYRDLVIRIFCFKNSY
ncbi:hypothetical protein [Novosphingobium sp. 11B]